MEIKLCLGDIGCFADGAHGTAHVRRVVQSLLQRFDGDAKLIAALNDEQGPKGLDWTDEDEDNAIEWMNEHACEVNVMLEMDGGDLLLVEYVK